MARQADDQIEITQVRSLIGAQQGQRRTMRALGLRRIRHTVTQPDRPEIRGMIAKVAHLIEVRYPGQDAPLDVEPGQEPKGAGQPPAGPSVSDAEAAELQEAMDDALSVPGSAPLGDLVQNPETLTSVDNPDRPKPKKGLPEDEIEHVTPDEIPDAAAPPPASRPDAGQDEESQP